MTEHFFWAPHPDDETIGMGGHIARAVQQAGPRPMVIFVFDALPSARAERLFHGAMTCPWHGVPHCLAEETNLLTARRVEANAAVLMLGADLMHLGVPESLASTDLGAAVDQIFAVVHDHASTWPDAVHHFPAGPSDVHAILGTGHPSHEAVWRAGCALVRLAAASTGWLTPAQIVFHRIYAYTQPPGHRGQAIALTPAEHAVKRAAIAEYRQWDPGHGRLAFGYHSVPELFEAAAADPHEYVETL